MTSRRKPRPRDDFEREIAGWSTPKLRDACKRTVWYQIAAQGHHIPKPFHAIRLILNGSETSMPIAYEGSIRFNAQIMSSQISMWHPADVRRLLVDLKFGVIRAVYTGRDVQTMPLAEFVYDDDVDDVESHWSRYTDVLDEVKVDDGVDVGGSGESGQMAAEQGGVAEDHALEETDVGLLRGLDDVDCAEEGERKSTLLITKLLKDLEGPGIDESMSIPMSKKSRRNRVRRKKLFTLPATLSETSPDPPPAPLQCQGNKPAQVSAPTTSPDLPPAPLPKPDPVPAQIAAPNVKLSISRPKQIVKKSLNLFDLMGLEF